jgi:hypothetical protein
MGNPGRMMLASSEICHMRVSFSGRPPYGEISFRSRELMLVYDRKPAVPERPKWRTTVEETELWEGETLTGGCEAGILSLKGILNETSRTPHICNLS